LIIHRLAYLLRIRNVQQGLITRSLIIEQLDGKRWKSTSEIAKKLPITAATVNYHLKNLENENVVIRHQKGKGWRIAPITQTELTEFLKKSKRKKKSG
jgi:predicted ArsR family transcriptional regulator